MTTAWHTARTRRPVSLFLAMALALAWRTSARAVERTESPEARRHLVLVVMDEAGDPFMDRVVAEIRSIAGLDIVTQSPVGSLDADARSKHAEVAIRKLVSGKGLEVWMSDATSGRSLLRQVIVDESPAGPNQSLIALQTGELLRTALLDGGDPKSQSPPQSSSAVASTAATVVPASGGENALQAGLAFLSSRGGVSPALQAWLSYQRSWSRHLGVAVDLSAPLAQGSISNTQGSANIGAIIAGVGLIARFKSESGRLLLAATLGGAYAAVRVTGRPGPDYLGESTTVQTGLVCMRLHGGWNPVRWFGIGAAAMFGMTTTRVRISFANHDVGDWGLPIAATGLYAEFQWE